MAIGDTPYDAIAAGKAGWRRLASCVAASRKPRCAKPDASKFSRARRTICPLPHRTQHLRLAQFFVTSRQSALSFSIRKFLTCWRMSAEVDSRGASRWRVLKHRNHRKSIS